MSQDQQNTNSNIDVTNKEDVIQKPTAETSKHLSRANILTPYLYGLV